MTTRTRLGKTTLTALGAVLALGVSACDNDSPSPDASGGSSSATPSSSDTASESPSTSSSETAGDDLDPTALLSDLSEAMAKQKSARVRAVMAGMKINGAFAFGDEGADLALTMSAPQAGLASMELRVVDGVAYISIPNVTGKGKFARIDESNQGMGQLLASMDDLRPDQTFEKLQPAVSSIKDVGPATVGGDETEHYRVVIDTAKAGNVLGSEMGQQGAPSGLPETMPYDFFVTDDSLVRRTEVEVMGQKMTFDYFDWGAPLDVKAPPASAIVKTPSGF